MRDSKRTDWQHEVGTRLRSIRNERKLTQAEVARAAGVSQSLIAQVETGKKSLPSEAIRSLATTLNIDETYLLRGFTKPSNALELLVSGWSAYDKVQKKFHETIRLAQSCSQFLTNHRSLLTRTTTDEDRNNFDRLLEKCEIISKWKSDIDGRESSAQAANAFGTLPTANDIKAINALIDLYYRLDRQDKDLVHQLIERLAGNTTGEDET